jgi:hypothetical protein
VSLVGAVPEAVLLDGDDAGQECLLEQDALLVQLRVAGEHGAVEGRVHSTALEAEDQGTGVARACGTALTAQRLVAVHAAEVGRERGRPAAQARLGVLAHAQEQGDLGGLRQQVTCVTQSTGNGSLRTANG